MYASYVRTPIYQYIRMNKFFCQTLRTQCSQKSHYETLNLKPNCTAEDIRHSFVKLSKENHPDTSANTRQNVDKFRAIVEAYKVLGKTNSRANYDAMINHGKGPYRVYNYTDTEQPQSGSSSKYYGVFGSKRISNRRVVVYCLIFMVVGVIVQSLAIRFSVTFHREKLDRVSMEAGKLHSQARANAQEFGNDYQLEKLAHRATSNAKSN